MRASQAHVGHFLAKLGRLCAGNIALEDAMLKAEAYAPLLAAEFQAEVFTPESLAAVASQCKFFPAYGELCDYLRSWWRDNKPFVPALPAPQPKPRTPATEEEKLVIAALTKKAVGYLQGVAPDETPEKPKIEPAYLSLGMLLAECDAAIVKYAGGVPGTPEGAFLAMAIARRDGLVRKLGMANHPERVEEMA